MSLAIALVVIAALCLVIILRTAVSRSLQISTETSLEKKVQPIDVEAFRNLANPAEDEYLHRHLPAPEFRRVRRERLRATSVYIRTAGNNAAVLIEIGQGALNSGHAPTVEAARHLVDQAVLLRRNATFALLRIYVALAWPSVAATEIPILGNYERLNSSAMLLTRLQNPAAPIRILSM